MTALRYSGVEYSKDYREHVFSMKGGYSPNWDHHVPISQILKR